MATSQEVLEFGRFKYRCDRVDFRDWLDVLEFLGFLQTFVFEGVEPEVVNIPRAELAVVVGANIQLWRASMEKGFLGTLNVVRQFVGLRASLERLRCALGKMGMIDPSAGIRMKPANTIRFISDDEAEAGSNELAEHFPSEYLKLVPSWAIATEKDSSMEKKWREWSDYDWWAHRSMNSLLFDVPLWHQFHDEVLPGIVANRPVEGEPLLDYIRNF